MLKFILQKVFLLIQGELIDDQFLENRFPLRYTHQSEVFDLGELRLLASLNDVYARLWERLLIILLTQGIKTFLISGFIFVLVQFLITRHLSTMARYAHEVTPEKLDAPLVLLRHQRKDELNEVVVAFNRMRKSLQDYYHQLHSELTRRTSAEKELLGYKNTLEEQVVERTDELRSANQKLREENRERTQAETTVEIIFTGKRSAVAGGASSRQKQHADYFKYVTLTIQKIFTMSNWRH